MAPFTHDHCPVCAAETRQRFLSADDGEFWTICETCATALMCGEDGEVVRHRPGTEEERAMIPERVEWTKEETEEYEQDMREGTAAMEAWFQEGCPGLTAEMVNAMPAMATLLAQRGVPMPQADPTGHADSGAAPGQGG